MRKLRLSCKLADPKLYFPTDKEYFKKLEQATSSFRLVGLEALPEIQRSKQRPSPPEYKVAQELRRIMECELAALERLRAMRADIEPDEAAEWKDDFESVERALRFGLARSLLLAQEQTKIAVFKAHDLPTNKLQGAKLAASPATQFVAEQVKTVQTVTSIIEPKKTDQSFGSRKGGGGGGNAGSYSGGKRKKRSFGRKRPRTEKGDGEERKDKSKARK